MSELVLKADFFSQIENFEVPVGVDSVFIYGVYDPAKDVDLVVVGEESTEEILREDLKSIVDECGVDLHMPFSFPSRDALVIVMKKQVKK